MKQQTNVITNDDKASSPVFIPNDSEVRSAVAELVKVKADEAAARGNIAALKTRIMEIASKRDELSRGLALNVDPYASVEAVFAASQKQGQTQQQIESLELHRQAMEKELRKLESDYRTFSYSISDAKSSIWTTIYNGLIQSIDKEQIILLFKVGIMAGKSKDIVIQELDVNDSRMFDSLCKQFNLE